MIKAHHIFCVAVAAGVSLAVVVPDAAVALSTKECSVKYKAAKKDGSLGGKNWADFRRDQCGADDKATDKVDPKAAKADDKPATPKVTGGGNAVYPKAVSAKFTNEKPHRQRFHTCLEQYRANKASGGNGGMKWVQKGGGYYHECNTRLKG